jgi:ankyrin repeat protein
LFPVFQNGALVDPQDSNNNTPLNWAAQKSNLQSIRILLEYNADVTLIGSQGNTPIMRLALILASGLTSKDDDACMDLLIRAAGQLQISDPDGLIPEAIMRDNKMLELLSPYVFSVRKLQDLCRFFIRRTMGQTYLPNTVKQLPLPQKLQDFLLLLD